MTGITLRSRVTYTHWRDGKGRDCSGIEAGTVLDRGPDSGTWWVSMAGAQGAVLVHHKHMTPSVAMHGQR